MLGLFSNPSDLVGGSKLDSLGRCPHPYDDRPKRASDDDEEVMNPYDADERRDADESPL